MRVYLVQLVGATFPSGIFSSREGAERYARRFSHRPYQIHSYTLKV